MSKPRDTIGNDGTNLLVTRRQAVAELRPPGETWTAADAPQALRDSLIKFRNAGIVKVVGEKTHDNGHPVYEYQTTKEAWEYRKEVYQEEIPGPCNHRGIRCVDGDQRVYTRLEDECDVTFGLEVFQARVNDGQVRLVELAADGGAVDGE